MLKTRIHTYRFDTSKPAEKAAWEALKARLSLGPHCMESWSPNGKNHYDFVRDIDGHEIDLETKHLFDNQWNTAPIEGISESGLRVFDWALDVLNNKHIKQGHYLDQTPEMTAIRETTLTCGYCGKHHALGKVFCDACLDSEYLKQEDLHLLRLLPVTTSFGGKRAPLTAEELAELLPRYKDAQLHGNTERGRKRIAKKRADILHKAELAIDNAKTERDGLLWLMDHGINIDNVIYYSHTSKFCFGWRKPVGEAVKSELLDVLCEFPFDYEIK